MKKNKTIPLDVAEYLDNEEIVAEYLDLACQSEDPALLLRAISHVARNKGMASIAEKTGLGRESLYKALNENAHPRFETVMKVLSALGIQIHLEPKIKFRRHRHTASLAVADKKAVYKV